MGRSGIRISWFFIMKVKAIVLMKKIFHKSKR